MFNFTERVFTQLKSGLTKEFKEQVNAISNYLSKTSNEGIIVQLLKTIEFKQMSFTPLSFYLIKQIEILLEVNELLDEYNEEADDTILEELFEVWSKSEWSQFFYDSQQNGDSQHQISENLRTKLAGKVMGFYHTHFKRNFSVPYYGLKEIGDNKERIIIGDECHIAKIKNDTEPLDISNIEPVPAISNKEGIYLLTDNQEQIERINKAITDINTISPELYTALSMFTHAITPLNDERMVSFSCQDLPGFSSINLYHRDDIDLLDDLLHENGHHILNYYLNTRELIVEDDEKIYYSPWRSEYRPIRGLYHATFTFFMAFKLFSDILKHPKKNELFTAEELVKIQARYDEEAISLMYCKDSLKHAYKNMKVTEEGKKLIDNVYLLIEETMKSVKVVNLSFKIELEKFKPITM